MKVYEYLQFARCELQKTELKKSGRNKFSNYDYFELSDFLPKINELMLKYKLSSNMKINNNNAVLTIYCSEDDSFTEFSCPVVSISMKGANEIQCQGAVITYIRRYLWLMAFEIVEHEIIDNVQDDINIKKPNPVQINNDVKKLKLNELISLATPIKNSIPEQLKTRLQELIHEEGKSLTADEYDAIKKDILIMLADNKLNEVV